MSKQKRKRANDILLRATVMINYMIFRVCVNAILKNGITEMIITI